MCSSGNGLSTVVASQDGGVAVMCPKSLEGVREAQGLSQFSLAKRLGMSRLEVELLEGKEVDELPFGLVCRLARALEVPLSELGSNEHSDDVDSGIQSKTLLIRIMKSVVTLERDVRHNLALAGSVQMIREGLCQLDPGLNEITTPWPSVGKRRGADELGRIMERPFPAPNGTPLDDND